MSELKLLSAQFLNSDQAVATLPVHAKTPQRLALNGRVIGYRDAKPRRFDFSDFEGANDGFASTLDAETTERYALGTTRARN